MSMIGLPKMVTCLWFQGREARPAAEFYAATFPDTHLGQGQDAATDYPNGQAGDELSVAFTLLGQPFLGLNAGGSVRPNEAVSFQVFTDDQAETDRYWDAIVGNGGAESQCSWCRDRWGFAWQIVPRALMAGMADPDRDAAARVMQAMMGMTKIDIAAIEAARRGGG